jgi:C4-dicarboxylate-specific signal transduction histidine kinase
LSDENAQVSGSVASIEAIISNLITNCVKAFRRHDAQLKDRKIVVRTTVTDKHVLIGLLDSGPGIHSNLGDRIWLPGFTSDENGTGLGLTIVKDTVAELGGGVEAVPNGELGGAEFNIELPRKVS